MNCVNALPSGVDAVFHRRNTDQIHGHAFKALSGLNSDMFYFSFT